MRSLALPDGILQRLKRETSVLHTEVERVVDIVRSDVSRADYIGFLAALRGFHLPIERQLRSLGELSRYVPDIERRWKVSLMEQDLRALGVSEGALGGFPVCDEVPCLTSVSRALGTLYVLEGSTLGGQIIHRHLRAHLPADVASASAFLTCYGQETGSMWRSFGALLTSAAEALNDEAGMVAAARETFATLKAWLVARA